jgi:hypothetical protein
VGADLVVVGAPVLDRSARMVEIEEPALVETLVAHSPVEALGEGALHGFPRSDELQRDAPRVGPLIKRLARELAPVVAYERARG